MVLKEEGFGELLPGSEAVIIDEAHQFPEVAQNFFNVSLSSRMLTELVNDLRAEALTGAPGDKEPGELADRLLKQLQDLRLAFGRGEGSVYWGGFPDRLCRAHRRVN